MGHCALHGREVVRVRVPAAGEADGDVGHTRLDHPPRRQAFLPERVPAVAISEFRRFVVEIEHFLPPAQDQPVGFLLGRLGGSHLRDVRKAVAQEIDLVDQFTAGLLPPVVDSPVDDSLHLEAGRVRIAARGERFVRGAQEALLGKPPGCLEHHDVGRKQPFVLLFLEEGEDGAHAGVGQPPAGQVAGLHQVGRRLVAVVAMGHAADQGVLVGLLGQFGEQRAELDSIHVGGDDLVKLTQVVVARTRLRVPGVVVRHAAPQEDLDDRLGLALVLALALAASSRAAFSSAAFCSGVFSASAAKTRELKPPAAIMPAAPKAPRRMASRRDTCSWLSGLWFVLMISVLLLLPP